MIGAFIGLGVGEVLTVPIPPPSPPPEPSGDMDRSGFGYQGIAVYQGHSLGWTRALVKNQRRITTGGTFSVAPGDCVILVNSTSPVILLLPRVSLWMREPLGVPVVGFERAIWIKDYGSYASAINITVTPFAGDKIDNLAQDFTIIQDRQLLRLYPLNDLTGWISG